MSLEEISFYIAGLVAILLFIKSLLRSFKGDPKCNSCAFIKKKK
jgi:hypothetical protein